MKLHKQNAARERTGTAFQGSLGTGSNNYSTSDPLDKILSRLDGVKQTGTGQYMAKCPAHDDKSPSLSIKQVNDRVLVHCFAGCETSEVLNAIGLTFSDLYDEPLEHHSKPITKYQRQRHGQAQYALEALRVEALIVLIAADRLAKGIPMEIQDHDRLRVAYDRIQTTCSLVGAKPKFIKPADHPPELKRPEEFHDEIVAEFAREAQA